MEPRTIRRAAYIASYLITMAVAAFGSLVGFASSGWGGGLIIIPVATAVFAGFGALLGGALVELVEDRWPKQ
jgi:hypothetical protein